MRGHWRTAVAWLTACLVASAVARAQLPRPYLTVVYPMGAKAGTTVEVQIAGADIEDATQLVFNHPGIKAEQVTQEKDGKQVPVANRFKVTVSPEVPPGYYDVRVVGRYGISNPRTFVVSDFDEITEQEPNSTREQAQRILTDNLTRQVVVGQINGAADVDWYVLALKKGQRILIESEAQRVDSRLNPVLFLYDSVGRELDFNDNHVSFDALLDFTAPEDGDYYVLIADQVYDGSTEYFYRLRVGVFPFVEHVLPLAGKPGEKFRATLFGRLLPNGQLVDAFVRGQRLEAADVEIQVPEPPPSQILFERFVPPAASLSDTFDYRLRTPDRGSSNPVPIGFTELPVVLSKEPNNTPEQAQPVTPPVEINGTFEAINDSDWFVIDAKKGEVWWIEIISHRMDAPTDPMLIVRRARDGAVLNRSDDDNTNPAGNTFLLRNRDCAYRLAVPEDGKYQILARDLYASLRGEARLTYRLLIRREQPDFRVFAMHDRPVGNAAFNPSALVLRKGGNAHLDVYVVRRDGFNGEITVRAEGMPEGVTAGEVVLGPGQVYAPLVLSAAEDAKTAFSQLRVIASADIGGTRVEREARYPVVVWNYNPGTNNPSIARLARSAYASVIDEVAPYTLVAEPQTLEVARGLPAPVKVKVTRRGDFAGPINGVTAMVLPPNVNNATVNIANNATEATLNFQTRTNTPTGRFSIAVRGTAPVPYTKDPSGKNKRNVNVYDPSTNVTLVIVDPVSVSPKDGTLTVAPGTTTDAVLLVARRGGFNGDVPLQFQNLPAGVTVANTTVKADTSEATIQLKAAESAKPGDYQARIRAVVRVGNQNLTLDFPLPIKVAPPEK